jgi:hypothetical protein
LNLKKPTVLKENDKIIIKFCLEKSVEQDIDKVEKIKYVVQVALLTDIEILEIRFDQIRGIFKNGENFYRDIVTAANGWLQSYLKINIFDINFRPIVKKVIEQYNNDEKNVDVIPYTTAMAMKDGSKAVLDIDAKKVFTMPILGELKLLIKNNEEKFQKSPEIHDMLTDFITSIEETSDLRGFVYIGIKRIY